MRLILELPDALHARPANLLVRLASSHPPDIRIGKGACTVSAKNILDVLALGAAKGDQIIVQIDGSEDGERAAAEAIRQLVERNFDSDLVPETGVGGVSGIAIGQAVVIEARDHAATARSTPTHERSVEEEQRRTTAAFARVRDDVLALVRALPSAEAALFEPEIAILDSLAPRVLEDVARGAGAEDAVTAQTRPASVTTDLLLDARLRLLDALADAAPVELETHADAVLVTGTLTPSLVAGLPGTTVGIVAGLEPGASAGFTSHAAILARGRRIPLAFVPEHVTAGIETGDLVVIDTTEHPARVWVTPSADLVESVRTRRDALARALADEETRALVSLAHLGVSVRVNVGAATESIPRAAEGVGLLRTELVFATLRRPPSEAEQLAAVLAIAGRSGPGPIVARLFDAGGDKPLPWLTAPPEAVDARGIGLLLLHEAVLTTQLRALGRAARAADVRVLLPLVRSERDVQDVRARAEPGLSIGAMVETPDAARDIDAIARAADFVCIGTNDLAAFVLGVDRADAAVTLDPRVLSLVAAIVRGTHAQGKQVTVCGELAGDERGARILVGLGVDALSVAPARVAPVRLALAATTRKACEELARRYQ
jgi:phosphotransferase system HPr (HPr) family protein